jgi:hypothetical protein
MQQDVLELSAAEEPSTFKRVNESFLETTNKSTAVETSNDSWQPITQSFRTGSRLLGGAAYFTRNLAG